MNFASVLLILLLIFVGILAIYEGIQLILAIKNRKKNKNHPSKVEEINVDSSDDEERR